MKKSVSNQLPFATASVLGQPPDSIMKSILYRQPGYTLIETVIALAILTTALLGLITLSGHALVAGREAIHHDLATLQARNLVERIRANPIAVTAGTYLMLSGSPAGDDCSDVSCDATSMARYDFREWNRHNGLLLPSGIGSIASTSGLYEVTIQWTDGESQSSHTLQFQP